MTTPYTTGTASVTSGSATVTGTGTGWSVALVTGGLFSMNGLSVPIAAVVSDTELTLAYNWPGSSASGAYAIASETSEVVKAVWTSDRLAQIITRLSLAGIHPDGAGTIAERDGLSPTPDAGYMWLRVEVGEDLEFYRRTASGWDGPFPVRGSAGADGTNGVQSSDNSVTNIRSMTQAEYDALSPIDPTTFYIVTD